MQRSLWQRDWKCAFGVWFRGGQTLDKGAPCLWTQVVLVKVNLTLCLKTNISLRVFFFALGNPNCRQEAKELKWLLLIQNTKMYSGVIVKNRLLYYIRIDFSDPTRRKFNSQGSNRLKCKKECARINIIKKKNTQTIQSNDNTMVRVY